MKIFHVFSPFVLRRGPLPGSQKKFFSCWRSLIYWCGIFITGMLTATAFPPLNWTLAIFTAPGIMLLMLRNQVWWKAALGSWLWGMGYVLCSFFWLREIHFIIPWLLMIVLGAYYIPVGWTAAIANKYILLPSDVRQKGFTAQNDFRDFSLIRQLLWGGMTACSLVLVEYLRHRVLPWNYLGVAFYQNAVLMQTARFCGIYGLSFLTMLVNAALAMAVLTVCRKDPQSRRVVYHRPWPLLLMLGILALCMAGGIFSLRERRNEYANFSRKVRLTLVQGNLSQRRYGGEGTAFEALSTYVNLTRAQQGIPTDLVVWPETAVNYPLRGAAGVCALYRAQVRELSRDMQAPLLLGTLDFDMSSDPPGSLNSAVLTGTQDVLREGYLARYSKVHPVPFGEYVPLRRYLPEWIINVIDMQRDLTPGKSLEPIELNDNIRLGVNICFEDVFPYISRAEFMRKANLLLVITNDAWYPRSSEPEQHLANALARAVEVGLPMVRCGNDSATCLITPGGEIIWSLAEALQFADGKAFRRGGGSAVITVNVPDDEQIATTFYCRFGDWLVALAAIIYITMLLTIWRKRSSFIGQLKKLD